MQHCGNRVQAASDGIVEAVNCEEAVQAVQDHDVAVVLLDLNLQQESGLDVLPCIKAMPSPPRVLIHSFHDGTQLLSRCFHAAADGYLVKGTNRDVLLRAVYQVARGDHVWTTEQLQQIRMSDACCSSTLQRTDGSRLPSRFLAETPNGQGRFPD